MNKVTNDFNKEECIENIAKTLRYEMLEDLPHHDAINSYPSKLKPEEIEKTRDCMIREWPRKGV